jgi:hypothetical protein
MVFIVQPFDIDSTESSLFSRWRYTDYYTMLVSSTGLQPNTQYANANDSQATYNIPELPAAYQVTATRVPGLFYVWYGSPVRVTETEVKADVSATIKRLRETNWNMTVEAEVEPQFVEFRSHTPFKLVVSADDIRDRFYDRLERREYLCPSLVIFVMMSLHSNVRQCKVIVIHGGLGLHSCRTTHRCYGTSRTLCCLS